MIRPVILEIVVPTLSGLEPGCFGCNLVMGSAGLLKSKARKDCIDDYPQDLKEMMTRLSSWIGELSRLYRHRLLIKVIDAQSPLGLWKQLRHGVFKVPAFIIDRKRTLTGWDNTALQTIIDEQIGNSH